MFLSVLPNVLGITVLLEGTGTIPSKPPRKFFPQLQIVSSQIVLSSTLLNTPDGPSADVSGPISSLVLCPINHKHVGLPRLSAPYLQCREWTKLHINFPLPVLHQGNSLLEVSWGHCRAHLSVTAQKLLSLIIISQCPVFGKTFVSRILSDFSCCFISG